MSKDEDFVPSEEEIEEAGKTFKVKKGPRYMTADQVRTEAPVRAYNSAPKQPTPIEDENDDSEAWPLLENPTNHYSKMASATMLQ